ncbi:MAG: sugar phosphate nucleotidyltransferase, partial [Phycisphaerae bacterium]
MTPGGRREAAGRGRTPCSRGRIIRAATRNDSVSAPAGTELAMRHAIIMAGGAGTRLWPLSLRN